MRVAIALLFVSSTASADTVCVISGGKVSLSKVRVGAFEVGVADVPMTATIVGSSVAVEIKGAIAFKGVAAQKIWFAVETPVHAGQLEMSRGANFVGDRASDGVMFGRAVIYASDTLEGEDKPPEIAAETNVPCASLSLEWTGDRADNDIEGKRQFVSRTGALVIHKEADDKAEGIRVEDANCSDDCLRLQELSHRGAWSEVAISNEGVVVKGWVRTKLMKLSKAVGYSYVCDGHHGGGVVGFGKKSTVSRARLDPGTQIFTAANGDAWATVQRQITVEVMYQQGDAFAEIRQLPNIDLGTASAWVPMKSVRVLN